MTLGLSNPAVGLSALLIKSRCLLREFTVILFKLIIIHVYILNIKIYFLLKFIYTVKQVMVLSI